MNFLDKLDAESQGQCDSQSDSHSQSGSHSFSTFKTLNDTYLHALSPPILPSYYPIHLYRFKLLLNEAVVQGDSDRSGSAGKSPYYSQALDALHCYADGSQQGEFPFHKLSTDPGSGLTVDFSHTPGLPYPSNFHQICLCKAELYYRKGDFHRAEQCVSDAMKIVSERVGKSK